MYPLHESLLVPVIEVTPERRFGDFDRICQIGKRDEAFPRDKVQHLLTTFFDEHWKILTVLDQKRHLFATNARLLSL
jgi:hypothetical protein